MSAQLQLPRTIAELHEAYEQGRLTPTDAARACLDRAKANRLNAWITVCEERALAQAEAATAELKRERRVPRERLPLFGVPMGVKDGFALAGVPMTCASRMLDGYVPPYTATVVARLESAGAITIGKTNLDEFAMGGSNENSAFGPVEHPTHPGRVPGGSSGGSVAAVAAGECLIALGSDTGGSVRLPASFCGAVGFKPTYGRASRYGLTAYASSLDQAGILANTAEDAALAAEAMAAHDPFDSTSSPRAAGHFVPALAHGRFAGASVGVPESLLKQGLAPGVERAFRASLAAMEAQGAELVPVELPHAGHAVATYYLVAVSEASSNLSRFDGVRYGARAPEAAAATELVDFYAAARSRFGAEVKRRILLGTFALSAGYADAYYRRACQVRRLIQRDLTAAFERVDFLALPVAPIPAFPRGEKADPLQMYLVDVFTVLANLAGLPALSVPAGTDDEKLPIGLQLMGPAFSDEKLLAWAHALERAP